MDDFINRAAPESFAITYGFDGVEQPDDHISYQQAALYLQDEWPVTPYFHLSGGIRMDYVLFNTNDFQRNDAVYALSFRDGLKIDRMPRLVPYYKSHSGSDLGFFLFLLPSVCLVLTGAR